jgi:hypothetical protein
MPPPTIATSMGRELGGSRISQRVTKMATLVAAASFPAGLAGRDIRFRPTAVTRWRARSPALRFAGGEPEILPGSRRGPRPTKDRRALCDQVSGRAGSKRCNQHDPHHSVRPGERPVQAAFARSVAQPGGDISAAKWAYAQHCKFNFREGQRIVLRWLA